MFLLFANSRALFQLRSLLLLSFNLLLKLLHFILRLLGRQTRLSLRSGDSRRRRRSMDRQTGPWRRPRVISWRRRRGIMARSWVRFSSFHFLGSLYNFRGSLVQ